MTMLPDIDQTDWEEYERQRLQQQLSQKVDSFGLQQMIGEKVAGLQTLVGGTPEPTPPPAPEPPPPPPTPEPPPPPPEPPAPEPAPAPPAPAPLTPEPEPAAPMPTPQPEALPPEAPVAAAPTPAPAPPPTPPPAPEPTPPPAPSPAAPAPSQSGVQGNSFTDWFGKTLNSVQSAGGDVGAFMQNYQSDAADTYGAALNAASKAGANVQQFTDSVSPLPPPPPATQAPAQTAAAAAPQTGGGAGPSGTSSVSGVPDWLTTLIVKNTPNPQLAADPDYIRTVAAGSKAESGWNPDQIQHGYTMGDGKGARGLFQFDMGGMGAGHREEDLMGQAGAELQASKIVPLYAKAYASAPGNLTGAEKASWVAAQAERPYQYDDPNSAARRGYASAYNQIGGGLAQGAQDLWDKASGAVGGAASAVGTKAQEGLSNLSQFGDKQLSSDEAYSACGPAAAVRFAQMYGRNPSLREATDLAKSVGWSAATGMAGIGSEKALMEKMGVPTKLVGADIDAIAKEAQTGNPVTISTPGHYFTADGYDPTTGAFHVGQSGLDLKGGSEWMTAAQMQARMGQIQGALFADNPQVPAPSTADQTSNPRSFLDRTKDAITSKWNDATSAVGQTASDVGTAARDLSQPVVDTFGRLSGGSILDQAVQAVGSSGAGQAVSDAASTVGNLSSAVGTGARVGLDTLDQQNQEQLLAPATGINDYLDAVRRGDPGDIAKASLNLGQQAANRGPLGPVGNSEADVSPALSAGLTAAGVDPNAARVLGQVGNVALPLAMERGIPAAAGAIERGAPRALDAALTGLENKFPAQEALATTDFGNLDDLIRQVSPQEARQLVGPAFDPSGRVVRSNGQEIEGSGLNAAGEDLLQAVDRGGVPGFISQSMRRIAADNGISLGPNSTPNELVDALRAVRTPAAATAAREPLDMSQIPMGAASRSLLEERTGAAPSIPPEATARIADLNSQIAELSRSMPHIQSDNARAAVTSEIARMRSQVTDLSSAASSAATTRQPLDMSQIPRGTAYERALAEGPQELPRGAQPITATRDEQIQRLNLGQYPQDLQDTIVQHAEGIDWANLQRRGVVPDEVSKAMADRYAADTSLSQTIERGKAGQAYNDYQTRALRNATGAQAAVVRDAASKVAAGGDDSAAALQRFYLESERFSQLTRIAEGARAESGRSLRAWNDPVRLVNMQPSDAVAEITKTLGGNREDLLKAINGYNDLINTGAGPIQMANYWASIKNPPAKWQDWVKLVRYNSMLSGPRTFEVNALGTALEAPWRLARDVASSVARGRPGEIGVELSGAYAGLTQANHAFLDTLFSGITREAAARGELPKGIAVRTANPIGKAIATGLEIPTRVLGATDEWMHAIDYGMSLGRVAARQASDEGLRGDAWSRRAAGIMANPDTAPQLMRRAADMADRMTYHGGFPESGLGAGLNAFTQRSGIIGNIVLPFLRTTYHITARGIDRSPVGLIGTGIDVARGSYGRDMGAALSGMGPVPKGVAPLGERLSDNVVGSAIFAGLYAEAQGNNISGAGPDNPQDNKLLRSEGWQPYSIRVGDKWVSYANWGPAAIPFAMAASAAETQRYAKPGAQTQDLVVDGIRRTAQIAQEQTYLQAIGTAWKGITDPAQYGSQFVNDFVTSLIPYGSTVNTLASALDPNARRTDRFNVLDAIQSRLPEGTPIIGGRGDVPVSQDVLGRPSPNITYGIGAVNPLRVSQQATDPVLREMDRVGYAPPAAPKSISRSNLTYQLEPDEQRQVYTDAGTLIARRVAGEIKSDTYARLNDTGKAKRLQMIVDTSRTAAENQFLRGLSPDDRKQRQAESRESKQVVPVSGRA